MLVSTSSLYPSFFQKMNVSPLVCAIGTIEFYSSLRDVAVHYEQVGKGHSCSKALRSRFLPAKEFAPCEMAPTGAG